jgi:hypothetical protein
VRKHVPPTRKLQAFVLVSEPRDGATAAEQLALEIRNNASVTGRCICGATPEDVQELAPGIYRAVFRHENDCPATSSAARGAVGL